MQHERRSPLPRPWRRPKAEQSAGAGRILLEVRDLRSGYGTCPCAARRELPARLKGEALGIVGHNGMGKTTLLKTLMGLLPATGGHITLDGTDVTREPRARAQPARAGLRAAGTRHPAGSFRAGQSAAGVDRRFERVGAGGGRPLRWPCSRVSRRCSTGAAGRCPAESSRCWRWRAR